jgi:hypothetical protein
MMKTNSSQKLNRLLKPGVVYRREMLAHYSTAVDRDLATLVENDMLEKLAAGLYYRPLMSRFGPLPPKDSALVKAFLKDENFLLVSWTEYNSLGLGLTQLYNRFTVYNHKRHGLFQLGDKTFDCRRPAYGFPKKLTPAFLLVDLFNHLGELDEDVDKLKNKTKKLPADLLKQAQLLAKKYGKVATKKFFSELNQT